MRAMTISRFGPPEVLELREMPAPQVRENDLLVEVHAAALNPVDTKIRRGMHGEKPFPFTLGFDVSGVVKATGPAVRNFKAGDEVYASPSLARNGTCAELVAVDARSAAIKPRSLDHVHAAALPLVTLTAWESLHERANLHTGETVLIHAGAGGVGHIAVQLARLHGCRVITTASRPQTQDLCRQLGADVIVDYRKESFVEVVQRETAGKGCPVIFDTVGGDVFDKCLDCVAVNGRLVTIVLNENARIIPALFRKNATLHMEFMGVPGIHGIGLDKQGETLRTVAELVDAGKLRPHVSQVIPLEEVPAAHRDLESGHVIGKIVVKVR
jgi:NADPH:quinone reductase